MRSNRKVSFVWSRARVYNKIVFLQSRLSYLLSQLSLVVIALLISICDQVVDPTKSTGLAGYLIIGRSRFFFFSGQPRLDDWNGHLTSPYGEILIIWMKHLSSHYIINPNERRREVRACWKLDPKVHVRIGPMNQDHSLVSYNNQIDSLIWNANLNHCCCIICNTMSSKNSSEYWGFNQIHN